MAGSRAHAHHCRHHDHQGLAGAVLNGRFRLSRLSRRVRVVRRTRHFEFCPREGACLLPYLVVFFSSNVYYEGGEGELGVNSGWVSFSRLVPLHLRASACACGYPSVPPRGSRAPQSLLRTHRRPLAAGTRRCAQDLARGARRSIRVGHPRFSLFARRRISLACPRGSRRRRPCGV